jgi:hypothetical protein
MSTCMSMSEATRQEGVKRKLQNILHQQVKCVEADRKVEDHWFNLGRIWVKSYSRYLILM